MTDTQKGIQSMHENTTRPRIIHADNPQPRPTTANHKIMIVKDLVAILQELDQRKVIVLPTEFGETSDISVQESKVRLNHSRATTHGAPHRALCEYEIEKYPDAIDGYVLEGNWENDPYDPTEPKGKYYLIAGDGPDASEIFYVPPGGTKDE